MFQVETIGDAYLVVAGIPQYVTDHADRVTGMAFSMLSVARTVGTPIGQAIQVCTLWFVWFFFILRMDTTRVCFQCARPTWCVSRHTH